MSFQEVHSQQWIGLRVAVACGMLLVLAGCPSVRDYDRDIRPPADRDAPGNVYFCSWNVENFYDDQDDPANSDDLEDWFAKHPEMFRKKVDHLTDALLLMNGGKGPDLIAMVEVENERCFQVLRDRLNERLVQQGLGRYRYNSIEFLGDNMGRRFAPGFLARIPAIGDRTRKVGNRYNGRILEAHYKLEERELIVIAGHWTSRVTDKETEGDRRMSYARDTYGRVRAIMHDNPNADIVVCGDFNDEFLDASMQEGLHVSRNYQAVRDAVKDPLLLSMFDEPNGDPPGSIYGKGRWQTFDHICVSRGMLDEKGWWIDLKSAKIFAPPELRTGKRNEPFKFGNEKTQGPRGYSDHFPVVALLQYRGR